LTLFVIGCDLTVITLCPKISDNPRFKHT